MKVYLYKIRINEVTYGGEKNDILSPFDIKIVAEMMYRKYGDSFYFIEREGEIEVKSKEIPEMVLKTLFT